MEKENGKEDKISVVEQKPKARKHRIIPHKEPEPESSNKVVIDRIIEACEEPTTQVQITGQPSAEKDNQPVELINFEITEEMVKCTLMGIFETLHSFAPKKFNNPDEEKVRPLTPVGKIVVDRWVKRIDILKYLPEITLAAGIISVINSMKIEEK